ncbi:Nucleotide-diphospho-sugar transferase family-containing protein [Strongyloides ratti]|uniref:Nucleotide-diphospho-sugar transferase family-containing protein n=1 Tax=Strongyloides ratti TaxID=34506 RepID=A0A090MZQ2_STRRB|nr:Nucleotide-diphospho-sugar transferase family-containing protein [Strongyloides ratti]CEF69329.1 Nucleotide-diphospho-sugar transferase family-containing protein [Strongyloides ratti]
MISIRLLIFWVILCLLAYDIQRRALVVLKVTNFIDKYGRNLTVDDFNALPGFKNKIQEIGTPAIILLNKYALNITLNFLCNIESFNETKSKILLISFDNTSYNILKQSFPNIHIYRFYSKPLEEKFKRGEGTYQFFQYFRASLSAYLTKITDEFWMIQCDTIWRDDLFKNIENNKNLKLENSYKILLDSESDEGLLKNMTAGGYFKVKSSKETFELFNFVKENLENRLVTDNNMMSQYCYKYFTSDESKPLCKFIPTTLMSNWRLNIEKVKELPLFLQYDGGAGAEEKFKKFEEIGALFVDLSTYNSNKVSCIKKRSKNPTKSLKTELIMKESKIQNKLNILDRTLCWIAEFLINTFPYVEYYMRSWIYPDFSYILTI